MLRARRKRKRRKAQENITINNYNGFFLQVSSCMYVFLTSFACMAYACGLLVMICNLHGAFPRLTVDLPSLAISGIAMVLWVHSFIFMVGSHVCFSLG